ncbi:MAG: WG repeat-containing protein [Prevotella sp.]|nr:WG repeat-containing protein [Prevotella sp.]
MKNIKIIVIFNVLLLCLGTNASAQGILGKLAKTGAGALKGTVKSTANLMVGSPEEIAASKRKDDPKAGNRNPEENKRTEPEVEGHGPGAGEWGGAPAVQIDFDDFCWECVSPSYDGIFCIPIGSSSRKFRFFRTQGGEQIGRSDWGANGEPHFNGGVCAVRSLLSRRWYILKSSGDSIALDPKITSVTNFMDGVAIASTSYTNHFFINDKGQTIYPTVKVDEAEIYPLIDGTRRLFRGQGGYGYLDGHGNVVIKPQYSEARNFSGGLAIVYDMMNTGEKYWVINTLGKKVSEVPATYASYGWTHSCWMTDFINSAAVAKNNDTGKYDIIGPDMKKKASFDYASPFCLKTMPSTAAVCVVRNEDWTHPQFCNPNGSVLDGYNNPGVVIARPTQPWIETENKKKEKIVRMPTILSNELSLPAKMAWVTPSWEYTGYSVFGGSASNDVGYVMDYEGIIRRYNWRYEKIDAYSADGYAKAIKKSTKGWRLLVSTWVEDLEDHMVFIDSQGTVLVEIIDKPKE